MQMLGDVERAAELWQEVLLDSDMDEEALVALQVHYEATEN